MYVMGTAMFHTHIWTILLVVIHKAVKVDGFAVV